MGTLHRKLRLRIRAARFLALAVTYDFSEENMRVRDKSKKTHIAIYHTLPAIADHSARDKFEPEQYRPIWPIGKSEFSFVCKQQWFENRFSSWFSVLVNKIE